MTMTIEKRVSRLEERTAGGDRCPECGWDGDPKNIETVVEWQNADSPTEPDEFCETCGRQLACTVHVTWDDSPGPPQRRTQVGCRGLDGPLRACAWSPKGPA